MLFGRKGPMATLGVDLGSTTTRIVQRGEGVVQELPTVVAIQDDPSGRQAVAIGNEARQMLGRTQGAVRVVRPVRGGVIEDWDALELFLGKALEPWLGSRRKGPMVVLAVPTEATETERRALQASAQAAGCQGAHLVSSALAGAIGALLPVDAPSGSMLVGIGGGRTEVAVISLGGLVVRRTIRVAGEAMDAQLVQWLRRHHDLMVGPASSERIKIEVGGARPPARPLQVRIRGRDLSTGAPRVVDVQGADVAEAIREPVGRILEVVLDALRETPPELSADILDSGVILVGGAARLRDLDASLRDKTGLPFLLAEQPDRAVALGLATLLADPERLERVTALA